jgi:transposase
LVQRTHISNDHRDDAADASRLLDLDGLAVERVEVDAFGGRVVHVVTCEETASACPACGVLSSSVKGRVRTRPRDIPYGRAPLRVVWHKRRWRCAQRACGRASFTEQVVSVPARARLTRRLRAELGHAVAEQRRCVAEAAGHYGVAWRTAHAAYVAHVQARLAEPLPAVTVLGIDETRRGKPVWKHDQASGRWVLVRDRWHTGFVDAASTGGLLAQVEGRSSDAVAAWLTAQPQAWRDAITHVAIDLSGSYAKAVREALPEAVLVADRFHLVRLANDTVTAVRQRVIREHEGRRGRKIDPAWRARRRLLTGYERLRPETFTGTWNALVDTADPGWEILGAYVVKESLRALLALAGTDPERHLIRTRLHEFYARAAASTTPEVHRLATTVEAWWPAIEAAILTGYSNARSEGYNRLAKHEGRNAFGFRNPANQRRRIRWACTRQHRRASAMITQLPAQVR